MLDITQTKLTVLEEAKFSRTPELLLGMSVDELVRSAAEDTRIAESMSPFDPARSHFFEQADGCLRAAWYKELKYASPNKSAVRKQYLGEIKGHGDKILVPMTEFTIMVPLYLKNEKDALSYVKVMFRDATKHQHGFNSLTCIEVVEL